MVLGYSKKAKRKVSTRLISRLAKKLELSDYMNLTIEAIKKLRATAWKNYRSVKPSAKERRQRFLDKRIEEKEKEGDVRTANHIRNLNKDEARRECQREFKQVMKPTRISKIMHIEVKSEENVDEIRNISDREEMEQIMMKNFKEKFLEVYDTNTTMEPLLCILGTDSLTAAAEDILRGEFVFPPVVHPDIIEFFHT